MPEKIESLNDEFWSAQKRRWLARLLPQAVHFSSSCSIFFTRKIWN
jgi:hypothetical protein